jgi:deoxyribonuclease-4
MPGVTADRRRIGAHLPLGHGMIRAANRAAEIGADALQVFSDNPTAWKRRAAPPPELPAFRERISDLGIEPLVIHASYLVNLAGPDDAFHEKSVAVLAQELRSAQLYGARLVNVHIGSHRGAGPDAGVERLAATLGRAFDEAGDDAPDPIVALENSAGGGFAMGATVAELAAVLDGAARRGLPRDRIAICLDTAHLWGAGYRISEADELDGLLDDFDAAIGLERLAMMHLNDSRSELGSHADRHQHIGAGEIGEAGMRTILCNPRLVNVPCFLETPGMEQGYDAINLRRCRELMDGLALEPLPEEALTMPGSRSRGGPAREPGDEEEDDRSRTARRKRREGG